VRPGDDLSALRELVRVIRAVRPHTSTPTPPRRRARPDRRGTDPRGYDPYVPRPRLPRLLVRRARWSWPSALAAWPTDRHLGPAPAGGPVDVFTRSTAERLPSPVSTRPVSAVARGDVPGTPAPTRIPPTDVPVGIVG
jgi:hypothetical protein